MFVYVWSHEGLPFYVGMTTRWGRTNPKNTGARGWLCERTLDRIGREFVSVEVTTVASQEAAVNLERELIEKYGRICTGTGSLTNLLVGGEGRKNFTPEHRAALSVRMRENNPAKRPEVREKIKARMQDPSVRARFLGDANPAKKPETREKIRAAWADPAFREARIAEKRGRAIHTEARKTALREKLLDPNNPLRGTHVKLNSDPATREKRVAALQSPEVRKRISEAVRAAWVRRKATTAL